MRWFVRGALLVLLSFANLNLIWSPDVLPNTLFAWTLVQSGNVDYDEFATVSPIDERPDRIDRNAYFFRGCGPVDRNALVASPLTSPRSAGGPPPPRPGEHVCSIFPPGVAILALPILVPAVLLGVPASDATSLLLLGHLVASLLEAAVALVLWAVFRRFVSARWSFGLVLLYFLATSVRTVASQALWQHAGVHLAIAAALWLVLDERPASAGRVFLAGLALGVGTVARQTTAFATAGIVSRRTFVRVIAGFGIGIIPLLVYNAFAFGDPFEQGYGAKPFGTPILTGLYGLLLSPSRGLLVYAPYLAFAIAALVLAWRRRGHVAARLRGLGIVALATLLLYATYTEWWGGRVFGPRFLDDQAPILFAALAWGIGHGLLSRTLWRRLFWIGAAWSLLLFNAAALVYDQTWDTAPVNVNFHPEKLFDWSDPQWLAVLRALPNGGARAAIGLALSLVILGLLLRLEGVWPRRLSSSS
ncbi:MAG TPA: hypothetical protein DCK98_14840 [Chloroflexi bacterium]|jgi:hypothetical protein|nr:hypothetical protein [Chloroflexota bacterium]HAL27334.1 hypothetical protein [Chloroflexota bacterium]